jgi:hypothetical protein
MLPLAKTWKIAVDTLGPTVWGIEAGGGAAVTKKPPARSATTHEGASIVCADT